MVAGLRAVRGNADIWGYRCALGRFVPMWRLFTLRERSRRRIRHGLRWARIGVMLDCLVGYCAERGICARWAVWRLRCAGDV